MTSATVNTTSLEWPASVMLKGKGPMGDEASRPTIAFTAGMPLGLVVGTFSLDGVTTGRASTRCLDTTKVVGAAGTDGAGA